MTLKFQLKAVNTGTMILCSQEDWNNAKHTKWYEVMADSFPLKKRDFVNAELIKLEDYINLKGTRKEYASYFDFRRTSFLPL